MGNFSKNMNTHFYMEVGDNFYETGVTNAEDSRFNVMYFTFRLCRGALTSRIDAMKYSQCPE